jgi:hypothetical protein
MSSVHLQIIGPASFCSAIAEVTAVRLCHPTQDLNGTIEGILATLVGGRLVGVGNY